MKEQINYQIHVSNVLFVLLGFCIASKVLTWLSIFGIICFTLDISTYPFIFRIYLCHKQEHKMRIFRDILLIQVIIGSRHCLMPTLIVERVKLFTRTIHTGCRDMCSTTALNITLSTEKNSRK